MTAPLTGIERLDNRIQPEPNSGCWLWDGVRDKGGYCQTPWPKTNALVHRLVYKLLVGEIPAGLVLDHKCRVRSCCNPAHLEPVTYRENTRRGIGPAAQNAKKTECKRGHSLSGENLGVNPVSGHRFCKECTRITKRDYMRRRQGYKGEW